MLIYPCDECKILSHVVLTPNMEWNPSILNFTEANYANYDEWLEKLVAGIIPHNRLYTPLRSLLMPPRISS